MEIVKGLCSILVVMSFPHLEGQSLDPTTAEKFAKLALQCVHREYPNKIAHVMNSDQDARPTRELTPAFYGCFDWHSSVHGHWLLARVARTFPKQQFAQQAMAALAKSLTQENLKREAAYVGLLTGPRLSGLTVWLGCCNLPQNCALGMIRKPASGQQTSPRLKWL